MGSESEAVGSPIAASGSANAALGSANESLGSTNDASGPASAAVSRPNAALGETNAAIASPTAAVSRPTSAFAEKKAAVGRASDAFASSGAALGFANAAVGSPKAAVAFPRAAESSPAVALSFFIAPTLGGQADVTVRTVSASGQNWVRLGATRRAAPCHERAGLSRRADFPDAIASCRRNLACDWNSHVGGGADDWRYRFARVDLRGLEPFLVELRRRPLRHSGVGLRVLVRREHRQLRAGTSGLLLRAVSP